uniref:Carboxymuconolactone decarboxylase-like domain-containing protein n=1 Tax=Eiseniibacteriota bacterium TaxID=2212470 RepID=A0A832HYZ6_UNCEI
MARRDARAAQRAVAAARRAGAPRRAAEETALMLVLHAGYPAALEGFAVLARAWPGRARPAPRAGLAAWRRRGARLCRRVYAAAYPRLVANVRALHPDLADMMLDHGYGRVLSRPGLAARARELVAVAVLAAGGWERQLVSHLLGAVRCGATPAEARAALRAGVRERGAEVRAAGARAWRAAFPRAARRARRGGR